MTAINTCLCLCYHFFCDVNGSLKFIYFIKVSYSQINYIERFSSFYKIRIKILKNAQKTDFVQIFFRFLGKIVLCDSNFMDYTNESYYFSQL